MQIRHKGITHECIEDAPGIGALVCAVNCHLDCKACFNQPLRTKPIIYQSATEIINEILDNALNEFIIFGGLEWSEQLPDMFELVQLAADKNLKIMIYTGRTFEEYQPVIRHLQRLNLGVDVYVKTGSYVPNSESHTMYGVLLASKNQQITKIN